MTDQEIISRAIDAGREDFENGFNEFNNPYVNEDTRAAWRKGFAAAKREREERN